MYVPGRPDVIGFPLVENQSYPCQWDRWLESLVPDEPRVFTDPVAVGLFPEATEAAIRGHADQFLEPSSRRIRANFVLRSRHAEDCLAEAVARGFRQYVVLGAGLDTFAFRQPDKGDCK